MFFKINLNNREVYKIKKEKALWLEACYPKVVTINNFGVQLWHIFSTSIQTHLVGFCCVFDFAQKWVFVTLFYHACVEKTEFKKLNTKEWIPWIHPIPHIELYASNFYFLSQILFSSFAQYCTIFFSIYEKWRVSNTILFIFVIIKNKQRQFLVCITFNKEILTNILHLWIINVYILPFPNKNPKYEND